VGDRRDGESYVSGDYTNATDNIYLPCVQAVVDEVARYLPVGSEEREGFVASFGDQWVGQGSDKFLLRRGSMMGNLGSFPVLCILNRVCHMRALEITHGDRDRQVLINGDDIAFCGDEKMRRAWLLVTSEVGLVVNEEKTGVSPRYIDLNSEMYDTVRRKTVRKLTFGFLATRCRETPVSAMFDMVSLLSFPVAVRFLTSNRTRRMLGGGAWSASEVPRRWWNFLLKKRWFRDLVAQEQQYTHRMADPERGILFVGCDTLGGSIGFELPELERKIDHVVGPLMLDPSGDREEWVHGVDEMVRKSWIDRWEGVKVCPPDPPPPSRTKAPHLSSLLRVSRRRTLGRLWMTETLTVVDDLHPEWLVQNDEFESYWRPRLVRFQIDPLTFFRGSSWSTEVKLSTPLVLFPPPISPIRFPDMLYPLSAHLHFRSLMARAPRPSVDGVDIRGSKWSRDIRLGDWDLEEGGVGLF
jgi:hypothetical protein